jgi:hypothetical protein
VRCEALDYTKIGAWRAIKTIPARKKQPSTHYLLFVSANKTKPFVVFRGKNRRPLT